LNVYIHQPVLKVFGNFFRAKVHFGLCLWVVEMVPQQVRARQITCHHPLNL